MKVAILAGGMGTRLSEETVSRPKPMVEIGNQPMIWHIMNIYSRYGFNEFYLPLGYKGEMIKEYFLNFYHHSSNLSIDLSTNDIKAQNGSRKNWKVHLIDTGLNTLTGGRLAQLKRFLSDGTFMLTYGDGVADVDVKSLVDFHKSHGKIATVTAVRPMARFGGITLDGNSRISVFKEKPHTLEGWINGGFFVFEPKIFDYLDGDDTVLEGEPMERLAREGQLMAYRHDGFWQCMDTMRDKQLLENLWASGKAPWKAPRGE
ncbi:MAG: glucose-1-phosphate cytidylyltransferase [Endomicrobiia bacterium]|nr:glucose-1-phosphate cytidylyltransferase [Endomicrobiia bacterium]